MKSSDWPPTLSFCTKPVDFALWSYADDLKPAAVAVSCSHTENEEGFEDAGATHLPASSTHLSTGGSTKAGHPRSTTKSASAVAGLVGAAAVMPSVRSMSQKLFAKFFPETHDQNVLLSKILPEFSIILQNRKYEGQLGDDRNLVLEDCYHYYW